MCLPLEHNTTEAAEPQKHIMPGKWGTWQRLFFLILGHLELLCRILYSTTYRELQILPSKNVRVEILVNQNYICAGHSLGYVVLIDSHHLCFNLVYKIPIIALTVTRLYYIISVQYWHGIHCASPLKIIWGYGAVVSYSFASVHCQK